MLIAGGKDKNADYTGLARRLRAFPKNILCGDNADLIYRNLLLEAPSVGVDPNFLAIHQVATYEEAVLLAVLWPDP